MKRLLRIAAGLYPRAWRERYEAEFHALLDDAHAGWREFFNVLGGALKMQLVRSRPLWIFAITCGAMGAVVAVALSFHARQYVSTAWVRIESPADGGVTTDYEIGRIQQMILSHSNLIGIITNPVLHLYPEMRAAGRGLDEVAARMARDVRIQRTADSIAISFAYPEPAKTGMVTRILSQQFAARSEQEARFRVRWWKDIRPGTEPPPAVRLIVLGLANLPDRVVWPKPWFYVLAGLALGLTSGFLLASIWFRPKRALAVAACAAAGLVLGGAVSYLFPDTFTSRATILISPPVVPLDPYDAAAVAREFHETEKRVFSDAGLRGIAQLAGPSRQIVITEDELVAQMKNGAVRVRLDGTTEFSIECSAHDPKPAKIMADLIVSRFEEAHAVMEREKARGSEEAMQIEDAQLGPRYEVLDLANLPDSPSGPPRLYVALAGLTLGLLAGALTLRRGSRPVMPARDILGTV